MSLLPLFPELELRLLFLLLELLLFELLVLPLVSRSLVFERLFELDEFSLRVLAFCGLLSFCLEVSESGLAGLCLRGLSSLASVFSGLASVFFDVDSELFLEESLSGRVFLLFVFCVRGLGVFLTSGAFDFSLLSLDLSVEDTSNTSATALGSAAC